MVLALATASCAGGASDAQPGRPGVPQGRGGPAGQQPGPVPVSAEAVQQKEMPVAIELIGNVEAVSSVAVHAQVTGELTAVAFREGDEVAKGQELFTLDRRALEAALHEVQANLTRDVAQLDNARATLARYQGLADRGIATREQLDQSRTSTAALEATVAADRAAVESAEVQLAYTTIRSPIDGRVGKLLVSVGNLVRSSDTTPLVIINQLSPIYVTFALSESQLPELNRYRSRGPIAVEARAPGDTAPAGHGTLAFLDNAVDSSTGTIAARATFPNADRRMLPGQFVNVRVLLDRRARCHRRSVGGGAGQPARPVRLRGDARAHGGRPDRARRADGGRGSGDQRRREAGRARRDRRAEPSRPRHARDGPRSGRGQGVVNLSALFIRRPVATLLLMLALVLFGVMAYRVLPVSDLPSVDFPTVQVSAGLPGASPETMASAVALPLEKQFATIAGVTSISSASTPDQTSITVQFDLSRNIDAAAQDVQAMISKASRLLPPQMPAPPAVQKVNPADQPVLFLGLNSPLLPISQVDEYAQTITQRISMVPGVASVNVGGSARYAVRIDLDPRQLAARGIGLDEVAGAVASANVNLPTGTIYGSQQTYMVETNGQLFRAAAYQQAIIAYRKGSPVRLGDVAHVYDGIENDRLSATAETVGDAPTTSLNFAIQKQPGANTVAVVDAVKRLLPELRASLPPTESLILRWDRSDGIRDSVRDVKYTLLLTMVLVVLVIFVFLRSVSATLIPGLALPASIIGTFAAMYLFGYSLDNLSLMALTLSVGFVVDDAIVMLENVVRHMEMGKSAMTAALDGAREVAFTIVSMTLSLSAVFIPILFMGGILGRLLHEFAVTIAVAILISGFVSISLTPMLCSRFLRPPGAARHGRLYNAAERLLDAALAGYDRTLRVCLDYRAVTFAASLALLAGTAWLFVRVPKGFLPSEDMSRLTIATEAPQGTTFPEMLRRHQAIRDVLRKDPNIQEYDILLGLGGSTLNQGRVLLFLKPRAERPLSANQDAAALRPQLARIPGLRTFVSNPPPLSIGGLNTRSLYQFTLQDVDTDELYRNANILQDKVRQLQGFEDVSTDMQVRNPQVKLNLDRDRIAALGLSVSQVETALSNAYGMRQVSTIYAANNQYPVIMQVAPEFQQDPAALSMLYVRSPGGALVPLNTVAAVSTGFGPLTLNHVGQLPSVTLSFNLTPDVSLSDAIAAVRRVAAESLPSSVSTSFQGTAQAFQDSVKGLGVILLLAVLVIYLVLGILYESFTQPLTILSGLPSAGFGALLALLVFKTELSVYAFVGVIMLVGLVKKNGIMMVDFALSAERNGRPPVEAILEACRVRFRPIMMTTMAALVGTLPIALGYGAGGESRRPLGLAVVGGLLVSQLLTLYITPVYYVYVEGARSRFARRRPLPQAVASASGGTVDPMNSCE